MNSLYENIFNAVFNIFPNVTQLPSFIFTYSYTVIKYDNEDFITKVNKQIFDTYTLFYFTLLVQIYYLFFRHNNTYHIT